MDIGRYFLILFMTFQAPCLSGSSDGKSLQESSSVSFFENKKNCSGLEAYSFTPVQSPFEVGDGVAGENSLGLNVFVIDPKTCNITSTENFPAEETRSVLIHFGHWYGLLPMGTVVVFSFDTTCYLIDQLITRRLNVLRSVSLNQASVGNVSFPNMASNDYSVMCKERCPRGLSVTHSSIDNNLTVVLVFDSHPIIPPPDNTDGAEINWLCVVGAVLLAVALLLAVIAFRYSRRVWKQVHVHDSTSTLLSSVLSSHRIPTRPSPVADRRRHDDMANALRMQMIRSHNHDNTINKRGSITRRNSNLSAEQQVLLKPKTFSGNFQNEELARAYENVELDSPTYSVACPAFVPDYALSEHSKRMSLSLDMLHRYPRDAPIASAADTDSNQYLRPYKSLSDIENLRVVSVPKVPLQNDRNLATPGLCHAQISPGSSYMKFKLAIDEIRSLKSEDSRDSSPISTDYFASYIVPNIVFDLDDDVSEASVYKVPSGVQKYDPPPSIDVGLINKHDQQIPESCSSKANRHVYADVKFHRSEDSCEG